MTAVIPFADVRRRPPYLSFTRDELQRLLGLYTSRVMRGEWRDYAIDHGPGLASFFIFRNSRESPLFVISKLGSRGRDRTAQGRNGRYVLFCAQKKVKQAHSLDDLLDVLNRTLRLVT